MSGSLVSHVCEYAGAVRGAYDSCFVFKLRGIQFGLRLQKTPVLVFFLRLAHASAEDDQVDVEQALNVCEVLLKTAGPRLPA